MEGEGEREGMEEVGGNGGKGVREGSWRNRGKGREWREKEGIEEVNGGRKGKGWNEGRK